MREIKFRAWDIERNHFKKNDSFLVSPQTGLAHPWYDNNEAGFANHNWIVMQYTGLTDKNGVEIYEGDIMLTNDTYHDYVDGVAINALPDGKFVEVKWENGAFFTGDEMLSEMAPYYEIIGNIYENPELLNNNN